MYQYLYTTDDLTRALRGFCCSPPLFCVCSAVRELTGAGERLGSTPTLCVPGMHAHGLSSHRQHAQDKTTCMRPAAKTHPFNNARCTIPCSTPPTPHPPRGACSAAAGSSLLLSPCLPPSLSLTRSSCGLQSTGLLSLSMRTHEL